MAHAAVLVGSFLSLHAANAFVWGTRNKIDSFVRRAESQGNSFPWVSSMEGPALTPVCLYTDLKIPAKSPGPPTQEITVVDLTPHVKKLLATSGVVGGAVTVISRHTTTALAINEWESRLVEDIKHFCRALAPPDKRSIAGSPDGPTYLHNDIDKRPDSVDEYERCRENGWGVDDPAALEAWRNQEPINAHSHLLSMVFGSSESIPIANGSLVIGQWQSLMLVDMDGPRDRTVGVQITGFK
mmetsp:Transcript_34067/g.76946  ORF Transcript_34067/g.76946 Transcript_34067/m.76946 type:complete len:241 (+) Transcript_34067:270-992(+)|eukprot:CAMPEP_0172611664 /NCGR_PEP_ID=MMETSP1068-20121228/31324_1 /TAXON_ID=35684 /ORGANISM="Pseudopedinella elastica, Strain CCMP716" /LENGTH=240 /DNA_ID=CAMNT_0013415707 /DNA_START=246 /DNA_END=968 /DNA_ORIENTATION=+